MKEGTIKNASRYLKNANVLANDFKQFLASCHVQQVNNLYVFIIMIFIDIDSYRYLEYYTIHWKKKEFSQITEIKIDAKYGDWTPIVRSEPHRLIH